MFVSLYPPYIDPVSVIDMMNPLSRAIALALYGR